jgi:hypothetical protein
MELRRELTSRRVAGDPFSLRLIRWLNGQASENRKASALARILDLIQTIKQTLAAIDAAPPEVDLCFDPPDEVELLLEELNNKFQEYRTSPFLEIDCGRKWFFEWQIVGKRSSEEHIAASDVIELTKGRLLDRVRSCACGKWFFARFSHQRSCSPQCRHKLYESTQAFKVKRRQYMREYYRLKMSGKVK